MASDLQVDAGTLGALVGAGGVISLLVQVPGGSGGDRWGRRPFFAAAMVLLVASQIARWLAVAPPVLLVAQLLGGMAQGIATVNAWALVADATEHAPKSQGQAFGILNANLALGLVAGYIVAGALGSLIGWRSTSLVLAAAPALAIFAVAWTPARAPRSGSTRPGLPMVLRSVAYPPRFALTVMAALTLAAGQGSLYLLPFGAHARDVGPFTAALLLVPYVVGSVVAGPLAGRIADRLDTGPVIVALLLVGAAAAVVLVWGAAADLVLIACFVLIGASVNGALPLLAVRVIALGDPRGVGTGSIIAGLRMGQSSGTFLGPALAGLVFARAGLAAGWVAQAACLLLSLALLWYSRGLRRAR